MKAPGTKQLFYISLLLFFVGCLLSNCKKNGLIPNPTATTVTKDSVAATDTLPSFSGPTGVALDAAGNIYVADDGNNLIRKISTAGIVSTFAGSGTQGSINATGVTASFNAPKGVAVDGSGNVYVADAGNNIIRKITAAGLVTTLAGNDSTAAVDGPGAAASFFGPAGVAVDGSGNVYVADAGNNLVRMVTSAGVVSTLAGGTMGAGNGIFNDPTGIAIDARGNLFIANNLSNTVLELVPSSGMVGTYAGSGQQGALNGTAASATFYYPYGLVVDAAENVYVADGVNDLIRKITPAGVVSTLAGSGHDGSADGTGTAASFDGPAGLAIDALGNIYVADSNNNKIRMVTPAGVVTTIAGNGLAGSKNGKAFATRRKTPLSLSK